MKKTTVSAAATIDSSSDLEDSINDSLFKFGALWALSLGYLPVLGCLMMIIVGH